MESNLWLILREPAGLVGPHSYSSSNSYITIQRFCDIQPQNVYSATTQKQVSSIHAAYLQSQSLMLNFGDFVVHDSKNIYKKCN